MAHTNAPRFRTTAWPGTRIQPTDVLQEDETRRPLEDEVFLRELLDLDVDDDHAVELFLSEHGTFDYDRVNFGEGFGDGVPLGFMADFNFNRLGSRRPSLQFEAVPFRVLRALVHHWLADLEGKDVRDAWKAENLGHVATTAQRAWESWVLGMNYGLRAYSVRIELVKAVDTTTGGPSPDLYSGICLQLYNAMLDDLPLGRCGNEPCQRLFIRQRGRAQYGQHRVDAIYCSSSCARAQAQRDYRLRQKRKGKR